MIVAGGSSVLYLHKLQLIELGLYDAYIFVRLKSRMVYDLENHMEEYIAHKDNTLYREVALSLVFQ